MGEDEFKAAVAGLKLKLPNRWMSISVGHIDQGSDRHIVPRGTLTSLCGVTVEPPQVWRGITGNHIDRCLDCARVVLG